MTDHLDFLLPLIEPGPAGYAVTTRTGERGIEHLQQRFGRAIWEGGDGAPDLNRQGSDPKRPWM